MKNEQGTNRELLNEALELFRQVILPLWHITRAQTHDLVNREYGITSSQFHTIRRIAWGDTSVSALAECMHVSRPHVSRAVDELVQKELVKRKRDLDDRRNIHLSLTEKGEQMIKDLHARQKEILIDQFSILGDEELRSLVSALKSMKKVIDHKKKK